MLGFIPRSLAVVGIVGAVTFSMPIAASADAWDYALFELIAGGAGGAVGTGVVAAAPEVTAGAGFACAAALPVCAGVAAAVIGGALFLTKDTWLPWFTGGATGTGDGAVGSVGCVGSAACGFSTLTWLWPPNSTSGGESPTVHFTAVQWETISSFHYVRDCVAPDGFVTHQDMANGYNNIWSWGPNFSGDYGIGACPSNGHATSVAVYLTGHPRDNPLGGPDIQASNMVTYGAQSNQPLSTASLQVSCTNPDGSQYEVTSAVPSANGIVQMPTCTGKAGDLGGARAKCATLSAGVSPTSMAVQSSDCVAAGIASTLYPECASVGCRYVVYADGVACTVGRLGCTDWARTYATSPGRIGCRYGEHWVSVDHCFMLERIYEASGAPVTATLANTDGDPATHTGTAPAPSTDPQTQPIPNGAPGGAPGTLPGGATGVLPSPGSDPQTNNDCWSGGSFSWNPVDWVMSPVKCALSWAFVPSASTLTSLSNGAAADLNGAGIAPMAAAVGANFSKVGNGSGCDGPAVTFSAVGIVKPMHPFSACTAPMSTLASISYAMTTVAVVLGGGWILLRAIGEGFGFHMGSLGRGSGGGQV